MELNLRLKTRERQEILTSTQSVIHYAKTLITTLLSVETPLEKKTIRELYEEITRYAAQEVRHESYLEIGKPTLDDLMKPFEAIRTLIPELFPTEKLPPQSTQQTEYREGIEL
ncbi:MAG: hypothetical protein U1C97_03585 [Candidatus Gracilibacteria bacterium]|nr:hypothetical protein [Candidatus Gracilibacteria bacterium]